MTNVADWTPQPAPQARLAQRMAGFSPSLRCGPFVFVSGTVGRGVGGEIVDGGAGSQADQALANIAIELDHFGLTLANVIRTRVYLVDWSDLDAIAAAHVGAFQEMPPACGGFIMVAGLYGDARVEIECEAIART